ncbi:hypothetical protein BGZ47_000621 [Haplosporangium gracile]|nr:hypothetical protein BGZ47_000621 [Haplosporangium gracile]
MPPRRTIVSSPELNSEDELTPKVKAKQPVKKEQATVMRTTRSEATRIATGSKPGTRTVVHRKSAAASVPAASKSKPTPVVKSPTKSVAAKSPKKPVAKPKVASAPKPTSEELAPVTSVTPASPVKALKSPAKRASFKQSSQKPSGTKAEEWDTLNSDAKQDQEGKQQTSDTLPQLELGIEGDWRTTGSKRPSEDCWLFSSLLKRAKASGKQSTVKDADFADEPKLEHVLRTHSRNTHEGQDEDGVDTWAVAFQPTLPVLRQTPGGAEEQDDDSGSDNEEEGDDDDVEEVRIRRRNKRLAKELSQQAPQSSSIVATCGGNTVCLIDCRLGKVMAKYSHVEEEEFMALAWTTLDHDQDTEGDNATTKEGRLKQTNILAAAGRLGSIKLINPLQNTCYKYLHGHTDSIVRLRCLAEFTRQGDAASVTAIGVSEKYLIAGTDQGTMAQYNLFDLNSKLESEQGKSVRKVLPERIYPVSQEWHESSIDDIIYIPNFSKMSYTALKVEGKAAPKADKKSSKNTGTRGRGRGRGGRGRDRGKGREGSSANRGRSTDPESDDNSDAEHDDNDEEEDIGEFVFASRESCQGEFIVWDAVKSTETDAALKTILEWSIGESWAKFTVVENKVTNMSLRRSLSSSLSSSSTSSTKPMGSKQEVEKMDWLEKRQSLLVAGMANGALAIYDLSRPPKRASDGNIIACKPDRIILNEVSSELLRDVAVSEDLSMMVGGDWSNKVLLWSRGSEKSSAAGTAARLIGGRHR